MTDSPRPVNGGSRPVPDPTALTDQAIAQAVSALRDYIDGQDGVLSERMAGHWRLDDERWTEFNRSQGQLAAERKDAAMARDIATEKSIDKSERATSEKIDKLGDLFRTTVNALSDKIEDVKERTSRIESTKQGATENRTGMYAAIGVLATVLFVAIAIAGVLASRVP